MAMPLISAGASLSAATEDGWTSLMLASIEGLMALSMLAFTRRSQAARIVTGATSALALCKALEAAASSGAAPPLAQVKRLCQAVQTVAAGLAARRTYMDAVGEEAVFFVILVGRRSAFYSSRRPLFLPT